MKAKDLELSFTYDRKPKLTVTITEGNIDHLQALTSCDLEVEVKKYRKKRSLTANGYFWTLLAKMADVLGTSKDELYLSVLERYGKFTHLIVKVDAVEAFKWEWRAVRELGEVTVNGKTGIQLQCYFGSSTYDSKEFSVLLNGVIEEAKELGIETINDAEVKRLIEGIKQNE